MLNLPNRLIRVPRLCLFHAREGSAVALFSQFFRDGSRGSFGMLAKVRVDNRRPLAGVNAFRGASRLKAMAILL